MIRKILWCVYIVLVIVFITIQVLFFEKLDFESKEGILLSGFEFVLISITTLLFGFFPSLLISLIPFRGKKYSEKLKFVFPLIGSVSLFVLNISFASIIYYQHGTDIKIGPLRRYDDIKIPEMLDCSEVRNGKFEMKGMIIERNDDIQYHIDKDTGDKTKYKVKWINDCEYELTSTSGPTFVLKVKIISVTDEYYTCHVAQGKYKNDYTSFYKLKRVN